MVFGDCFHLSDALVSGFPAPPELYQHKALNRLSYQLAQDLHANAEKKSIETKDGDEISYEEFYGSRPKSIIDKVDRALISTVLVMKKRILSAITISSLEWVSARKKSTIEIAN